MSPDQNERASEIFHVYIGKISEVMTKGQKIYFVL